MPGNLPQALRSLRQAVKQDDLEAFRGILAQYPDVRAHLDDPISDFDSPIINCVRSAPMLDLLIESGADINARSRWWAGGFGLLDSASPDLAAHAIQRGVVVTIHAAARLGMLDKLKELIAANPDSVHLPGGDGQTPLHFAATEEIAEYLLDHGAKIDARDVDHESTPAQYAVKERQEITRFLIRRGCQTDLLMAAALGDMDLARKHLKADPECIRLRVSEEYFPMVGGKAGGTIYQWQFGWHVSSVQVAKSYGHAEMFQFLMDQCPDDEKLLNACWLHDEALVRALGDRNPTVVATMPPASRRHLAHAARNNDTKAARLMLGVGMPFDGTSQHRGSALHWAAWHGNAELVNLILLRRGFYMGMTEVFPEDEELKKQILAKRPSLEDANNDFKSTPMGWAAHGSENSWHHTGDYAATVETLLKAGCALPKELSGSEPTREVLRRHGMR